MYTCMLHMYAFNCIIFTLPPTALQLKNKKEKKKKAILASALHLLQLNLGCNNYFFFMKER